MNTQLFSRLLRQNFVWLILLPVVTALTVYYFTRNQPSTYESTATLYTGLASGYSILTNESNNARVDHEAVDNAFENLLSTINSRETMIQVGTRLLSRHLLLEWPDTLAISKSSFKLLRQSIPADLRLSLIAGRNEEVVYHRVDSMAHAIGNNPIKKLLNNPSSKYAPAKIAKELKATRKKDSDMLELAYQSDDAAVTYSTLTELINVFSSRYAGFKTSETSPVVNYYNNKYQEATRRLQQAEQRLKAYETNNDIINFDEESRNVAVTKEAIETEYNEELMKFRAAKASMDALAKRLDDRMTMLTANEELSNKRQELTNATTQVAEAKMAGRSKETVDQLTAKANRLSDELKIVALKYYKAGNTAESIPQTRLLDEWLLRVIQFEESKARLSTYEKRLSEFKNLATKYAPMGSTLAQMKRDISVAEKDYMTTMAALNQARTRQTNAEMTGPLKLLDAPQFPLQPLPSKRWMIIGAAFGVGIVLALLLLLIRYLVDGRIYDPVRLEVVTGLTSVALFPMVSTRKPQSRIRVMLQYMLERLRSTAAVEMLVSPDYRPYSLITLWSTQPKQGKTWLASQLAIRYALAGKRVAFLYPYTLNNLLDLPTDVKAIAYEVRTDFAYAKSVEQVVGNQTKFNPEEYDIVLLELPDLSFTPIATYLVAQSNLMILVVSARSSWNTADQDLYQLYRKATSAPILPVLNHVHPSLIEVTKPVDGPVAVSTDVVQPSAPITPRPSKEIV